MGKRSDFNDLAGEAGGSAVATVVDEVVAAHHELQENAHERASTDRALGSLASAWQPASGQHPNPKAILEMVRASDVQPEPINWLWKGLIASGKLTLFAGDPGLGKSMVTVSMAAHVSTGTDWPAAGGPCPLGDVLFVSAEDDPSDTIRPRLDAAGADPKRVFIVKGVEQIKPDGKPERRMLSLRKDLEATIQAVRSLKDCKLIIIDPISAYLDGVDSHNNADIRGLLAPLADVAREVGAAIVAVTHLNKGSGGSAMYRATGSLAFVAAARAAFLVAKDKGDPERRLFLPLKNNLGKDTGGMAYRIVEKDGVPFVDWEDAIVDISADDALGQPDSGDHETTLAEAGEEWLREVLSKGSVPSDDIKAFAKQAGYSWSTIRRAQANIGIKPKRDGGFGKDGTWVWSLPEGEESPQMNLTTA